VVFEPDLRPVSKEVEVTVRANGSHVGDLGRRITYRREQLGLTRDEAAGRAGMDSGYLDYLEHSAAANPTLEALVRKPGVRSSATSSLSAASRKR
jgi:hypothetical protein